MRPPMCSSFTTSWGGLVQETNFRTLLLVIVLPLSGFKKIPLHRLDSDIYKVLLRFFKNTIGGINLACLLILI